jgi:hypothetical protein
MLRIQNNNILLRATLLLAEYDTFKSLISV